MSELQCLMYVSTATCDLGVRDILGILGNATELNRRDGVHGMLLLSDGDFMQCIEGEVAGVESTYARIRASRKHHEIVELRRSTVAQLQFSGWDWGFQSGFLREFSNPETARFLETPQKDLQDVWEQITPEKKILREFWETRDRPFRIWKQANAHSGSVEMRLI